MEAARPGWRLDDDQAKALDKLWDLNGHFRRLLRYARAGHDPDWFKQHVTYEARATVLKTYESMIVPGLLQTEAYARAWLVAGQAVKNIDAAVEIRMARQNILNKEEPPLLWVLLDECVLDRPMGGRKVMKEQLTRLLELSELPHLTIRVVPRAAGGHLGLEGPFIITTVTEGDVAYLEACGGGRLSTDKAEVRRFGVRFDRIGALALPMDQGRVVSGFGVVSRQGVGGAADLADQALACPLGHLDTETVQVGDA
jgi:hypothetical protein